MFKLVHGEVRGLTWYEIPRAAGGWAARDLDPSFDVITVVAPLGRLPRKHILDLLATTPEKTSIVTANYAFRPFDPAVELPGRAVMYAYHDFDDEAVDAWAKAHLPIPPELDLTFAMGRYGEALSVTAATIRKGRLVHVRRRLDPEKLMADAFAEHLPYLVRNCPRPSGTLAEFTCAAHVQEILSSLQSAAAVAMVRRWLDAHRRKPEQGVPALHLQGDLLPGTLVNRLDLDMFAGTNAVKASVHLDGGHTVFDIDTGVNVTLRGEIPQTVASALKGRSLSDAIDAPWADRITIRTVREAAQGSRTLPLRGNVDGVELALPDRRRPDDEQAMEIVRSMTAGDDPRWKHVQATVVPVLSALEPADLVEVMHMLVTGQVDLADYGQPGWLLRGRGAEIVVDECPSLPAGEALVR